MANLSKPLLERAHYGKTFCEKVRGGLAAAPSYGGFLWQVNGGVSFFIFWRRWCASRLEQWQMRRAPGQELTRPRREWQRELLQRTAHRLAETCRRTIRRLR